jgi:hypothetical protein
MGEQTHTKRLAPQPVSADIKAPILTPGPPLSAFTLSTCWRAAVEVFHSRGDLIAQPIPAQGISKEKQRSRAQI